MDKEKFTTVGDLIDALSEYDRGTPLLGLYSDDTGSLYTTNLVSVMGVYPDSEGRCINVQVSFWEKGTNPGCKVNPTGEKWDGGLELTYEEQEQIASALYSDRALSGPDSLYRTIKDWG